MKRVIVSGIFVFSGTLLFLLLVLPHFLPVIVQNPVNQKIREITGLERFHMEIQKVGLTGVGIGKVTTGQSLSIDSIYASFSPLTLIQHPSVETLTISGLHLTAVMGEKGFSFLDFPLNVTSNVGGQDQEKGNIEAQVTKALDQFRQLLPFLPRQIEVMNAMITLKRPGEVVSIPFSLRCTLSPENGAGIALNATLFPFGEAIELKVAGDIKNGIRSASLVAHQMDMGAFNTLIAMANPNTTICLKGRSDLSISLMDGSSYAHPLEKGRWGVVGGDEKPLGLGPLKQHGPDLSQWRISLSHLGVMVPSAGQMGAFLQNDVDNFVSHIELNAPVLDQYRALFLNRQSVFDPFDSSHDAMGRSVQEKQSSSQHQPSSSSSLSSPLNKTANASIIATGSLGLNPPIAGPLKLTYQLNVDSKKRWKLEIEGEEAVPGTFALDHPFQWISAEFPYFKLDVDGNGLKGTGQFKSAVQNFGLDGNLAIESGLIDLPELKNANGALKRFGCDGEAQFDYSDKGEGLSLTFTMDLDQLLIGALHGVRLFFPKMSVPGAIVATPKGEGALDLKASLSGGTLLADPYGIQLKGIGFDLPFYYPFSSKNLTVKPAKQKNNKKYQGRFSVNEIYLSPLLNSKETAIRKKEKRTYKKIGHLAFKTEQFSPKGVQLNGAASFQLAGLEQINPSKPFVEVLKNAHPSSMNGITLSVNAKAEMVPERGIVLEAGFDMAPMRCSEKVLETDWLMPYTASLIKGLRGEDGSNDVRIAATLSSNGKLNFQNGKLGSQVHLTLDDGDVVMPDKKFHVSGIQTAISFEELPKMRSVPGGELHIDGIKAGEIDISNVKVTYALESPTAFLIEKMGFNWCEGRVMTEAMRISTEKNEYHLNLFCDRLGLSAILHQLGAFHAEGEGSLNGRIPISYVDGNISFDNGFLYSTPGKGGVIRITGTDVLLAGIPMNTPQFAQIDLAREALKHYQYEWARLFFNTEGDELVVKMEFDGKPKDLLPFVYKKEVGSFVRVGASNPGSNFQGINLSVNLRLPFNKVLKFGNRINSLF